MNKYYFTPLKKIKPVIIFLSSRKVLEKFKRIVLPLFLKQSLGGLLTLVSSIIFLRHYGAPVAGGWVFWLSISTIPSIFYQPFAQTVVRFLHSNHYIKNQSLISILLSFSLLSYFITSVIILVLFFQLEERKLINSYLNIGAVNFFYIFLLFQLKSMLELITFFCSQIYIAKKEVLRIQGLLSIKRLVEFFSLIFCIFSFRQSFQYSLEALCMLLCISELFFSFKFFINILALNKLFPNFRFSISKSDKRIVTQYSMPAFFNSILSAFRSKLCLFYLGSNAFWEAAAIFSIFQGIINLLNKAQANMLYNLLPFLIQKKKISKILNKYIYSIISAYYGVVGTLFFLTHGILIALLKLKYDIFNYDLIFLLCFNFVLFGFLQANSYKVTFSGNQIVSLYLSFVRVIIYCTLFYFFHANLHEIFFCEIIASSFNILLIFLERKIRKDEMRNTLKITIFFLISLILLYTIIKRFLFGYI